MNGLEDDDKYRSRLRGLIPKHSKWYPRLDYATTFNLDEIGGYYDIKRGEYAIEAG